MIDEGLPDRHRWYRICEASWDDPLFPSLAAQRGGRWNPPDSWPTLYLNEDLVTARLNLARFIAAWPYEPEDLADDTGLPATYPLDDQGQLVAHERCRPIGTTAHALGLRGVRCRSARTPHGAGRELAWFPATRRSRAHLVERWAFSEWFWG